jgi:dihydrodipicolinate synthase/N-acetylneuraminate lyase
MMRTPPRLLPALITPFGEDGVVDEDAHRHNAGLLAERGAEGFVIAGSTGQGPYLLPGERRQLIGVAREAAGLDSFLLCGILGESVAQATAQIEEAVDGGADAVLVVTPTTLIRNHAGRIARYYRTLAESAAVPVWLYSMPAMTAYQLPIELAAELADHPNIVGLKDSGAEANRVVPLADAIAAGFFAMAGTSKVVNEFVLHGAHGAITASSNYAYELVSQALDNEYAQEQLTHLSAAVERFGLAGTYAAAEAAGLIPGTLRLPLENLEGADRDAVALLLGS